MNGESSRCHVWLKETMGSNNAKIMYMQLMFVFNIETYWNFHTIPNSHGKPPMSRFTIFVRSPAIDEDTRVARIKLQS